MEKALEQESKEGAYQRLKVEHALMDEKIAELEKLRFPTTDQEMQIKRLKKEKLALKDRIERMTNSR